MPHACIIQYSTWCLGVAKQMVGLKSVSSNVGTNCSNWQDLETIIHISHIKWYWIVHNWFGLYRDNVNRSPAKPNSPNV